MPKILLDSAYRDTGTSEEYTIILQHAIKDVKDVRLDHVTIPRCVYMVDSGYNSFGFTHDTGGTPDDNTITLTTQNYTPDELAAEIESALNTSFSVSTYSVTYDDQTNKFTTSNSAVEFSYDTGAGSVIAGLLGIPTDSATASSSMSLEHPNQIDTSFPRYLLCNVETGNTNNSQIQANGYYFSFAVDVDKPDPYDIDHFSYLQEYLQDENNNNKEIKTVRIKWSLPDPTLTLNFNGINNQIILDVGSNYNEDYSGAY